MKPLVLIFATLAPTACGGQAAATSHQTDGAPAPHGDTMHPAPSDTEDTRACKQSMTTMMADAPAFTDDADVDFMQQMRVHHAAAVAMARSELVHGQDADARALAQAVIDAQQQEIEQIDRWLRSKGR